MPEIPDLESYALALRPRLIGARLETIRMKNPFFLRTAATAMRHSRGSRRVALGSSGRSSTLSSPELILTTCAQTGNAANSSQAPHLIW
jgi:hypothetical protein